jgi:hypothetical protein
MSYAKARNHSFLSMHTTQLAVLKYIKYLAVFKYIKYELQSSSCVKFLIEIKFVEKDFTYKISFISFEKNIISFYTIDLNFCTIGNQHILDIFDEINISQQFFIAEHVVGSTAIENNLVM